MKKILIPILLLVAFITRAQTKEELKIKHELNVKIIPAESRISVKDRIIVPPRLLRGKVKFSLNANLKIVAVENAEVIKLKQATAKDLGMDRENTGEEFSNLKVYLYSVKIKKGNSFVLKYKGKIESPITQSIENYQRGFSQSPGIISPKGIFLGGSTYWVPTMGENFFVFKMKTTLPDGWKTVSQGRRTLSKSVGNYHIDVWEEGKPQEEIFLIGAKFVEYGYVAGRVKVYAFLRNKDDALANRYLEATAQYLDMYQRLLGQYPYSKFALVENFWETGYGMPSFTLLGEKIIRFPFIIVSSYPHELLHNYWGNGVYVDFSQGNWCEGITAYMADHLLKEQHNQGVEYRRNALQRFTDYVNDKNDFPLKKFRSRYDKASEAIGYGKSLMMWHMLRQMVGDNDFVKSFKLFYNTKIFRRATFDDIRKAFEKVSGKKLQWFFKQWVNRKGAPSIELQSVRLTKVDQNKFNLHFELIQKQKSSPFRIFIPVYIRTEKGVVKKIVEMNNKKAEYEVSLSNKPLALLVDPEFDVFRRLSDNEIPPSLSKIYGIETTTFVFPEKSSAYYQYYKEFVHQWINTHKKEKFILQEQKNFSIAKANGAVWILGFANKGLNLINKELKIYSSAIKKDSVYFKNVVLPTRNNGFVITVRNPEGKGKVMAFLSIGNKEAVNGLVTKLPHYGKYSYLAFEGNEPTNVAKGEWEITNSPMRKEFVNLKSKVKINPERALIYLNPVFSAKKMISHIGYLSSDELKGRGLGTTELNNAAKYIADKFKKYGLKPGGEGNSYFESWTDFVKGKKGKINFKNVIGIIPGNDPALKKECVVISAHYDHLGLGWPDVHKGDEGKIHHGADDNASGVAVMMEEARVLAKSFKPSRTIIFVAFTGEEEGLLGSKYFVEHYVSFPPDKVFANINLDTVGRLFNKPLLVLDASSAKEWRYIFMGVSYVTGVQIKVVNKPLDSSDQISFINKGVPSVQLFSGANEDYHRPTDTIDKIDPEGLVKVASVLKETIEYLTERKEPLSFKKGKAIKEPPEGTATQGQRRVTTGSIPDFTYDGEGIKLSGVVENSPAAKSGLKKGDIIIYFDDKPIKSLRDYSNLLKKYKPGDIVTIKFLRNGKTFSVKLKLKAR